MSIFDNGLAHLKPEKDEVEGTENDFPVYIRLAHLKADEDEVEEQEDVLSVYIYSTMDSPT